MPPKVRKYESGYEKRKKKKRLEELTQSQKGALDKFIVKESNVLNENIEDKDDSTILDDNVSLDKDETLIDDNVSNDQSDDGANETNVDDDNMNDLDDNDNDSVEIKNKEQTYMIDIYDPRNWDGLDSKMIDVLVLKGPKRDSSIEKGPRDKLSKRFCATLYTRVLPNGEKCDREWLVYSKELDRIFCFCCKIFKNGVAIDMDIDPIFPRRREIRRKKFFDENTNDASSISTHSPEESFRVNYFLYIVDQAIVSLKKRFEQYQEYENIFGFLFTSHKLRSLDDSNLKSCCAQLEIALQNNEQSDVDGNELYVELKLLQELLPSKNMGPIDILKFLKGQGFFPNAIIAYRILLTIPVTVASAERSFSKLKLLKSYMRSTMSQERLNGLALVAIENDILEQVDCEDLINDFASKNARRMAVFK